MQQRQIRRTILALVTQGALGGMDFRLMVREWMLTCVCVCVCVCVSPDGAPVDVLRLLRWSSRLTLMHTIYTIYTLHTAHSAHTWMVLEWMLLRWSSRLILSIRWLTTCTESVCSTT